jgi:hypothetical protein
MQDSTSVAKGEQRAQMITGQISPCNARATKAARQQLAKPAVYERKHPAAQATVRSGPKPGSLSIVLASRAAPRNVTLFIFIDNTIMQIAVPSWMWDLCLYCMRAKVHIPSPYKQKGPSLQPSWQLQYIVEVI